jgi:hypothetical protein
MKKIYQRTDNHSTNIPDLNKKVNNSCNYLTGNGEVIIATWSLVAITTKLVLFPEQTATV